MSQEPNEHVMRKRDALASIVLKHREIADWRKDRLKQHALHVWVKLQQPIGGAIQLRPCLPFGDRVEGASFLCSRAIILASGLDIAKQSTPDLPNGLLHGRASLRFARKVRIFLDQR